MAISGLTTSSIIFGRVSIVSNTYFAYILMEPPK